MPTPSIQTLRTDAQQVLNLDSISAVRSVVAATLANANAGTPLNPNLTTQQLWNEFYQIVTQPKSDIESIIANQLMKFMYAPPAPGGVGANGQVIFNDGGVLAGDPQFLWNKTTNLLTVTGSATITGDLTVATNKLKVTGGNVGIGTATPTNYANYTTLTINGTNGGEIDLTDGGTLRGQLFSESTGLTLAAVGGFIKFGAGTGGTEKMRLDTSGNLGISVTPSAWGAGYKALQFGQSASVSGFSSELAVFGSNCYFDTTDSRWERITSGFTSQYYQTGGTHVWRIGGTAGANTDCAFTQAMTLDASGNLLLACTSAPTGSTSGFYFDATRYAYFSRSAGETLNLNRYTSTGATAKFRYAGTEVGDISVTGAGTTYNSTSDYRLKESVAPLSGGLARVSALKPSIYKWKSDGSSGEGFLAHELAEVVPAAVTGEKDAVNEDGSIKSQSIDMSRVVPILVAAIQELTARVQTLEAK